MPASRVRPWKASVKHSTPARPVAWRSIGPGQFGGMFGVGISPHDSKVIVAGVDMGHAFMTRDGGKTFERVGNRHRHVDVDA